MNPGMFQTKNLMAKADTINDAGGSAYSRSSEEALAQYAVTGCFNSTFYVDAEDHLHRLIELCNNVSPTFVAQCACFARTDGHMKDMPAFLCAYLTTKGDDGRRLLKAIFPAVINTGKMLRNFVQIIRSGRLGRKSLGKMPKRLVQNWLRQHEDNFLLRNSVGKNPSMGDLLRMTHPAPRSKAQSNAFRYLMGKSADLAELPLFAQLESFRKREILRVPAVPFELISNVKNLTSEQWRQIVTQSSWQWVRMNLNTLVRNGVFEMPGMIAVVADKLSDTKLIQDDKGIFPYQILNTYLNIEGVPSSIKMALNTALETSVDNLPDLSDKNVAICIDVSGSMEGSITGRRKGSTSKMRCVDVAALIAVCIARKCQTAQIVPFNDDAMSRDIDFTGGIIPATTSISEMCRGGTSVSSGIRFLNKKKYSADALVIISDNQSWADYYTDYLALVIDSQYYPGSTAAATEWKKFKGRNPQSKLVLIDLTPNMTTQLKTEKDVLNIGGFSDSVFNLLGMFLTGQNSSEVLLDKIHSVVVESIK